MISAVFRFLQQFDDFVVVGADFFHRNVVIDDINDAGQVFAHIGFDVIGALQQPGGPVVQISGDQPV